MHELEAEVRALEAELADPALYQRKDGAVEAVRLNGELTIKRSELDRAMEAWSRMVE